MKKYQDTFKRYEMKYLLEDMKYSQLGQRLQEEMIVDRFGKTTICNIYFDTPEHRLIQTSLEKPVYKEKLRLRSYGTPKEEDTVFIELKKKYKGVVYKRREKMGLSEAERYLYSKEQIKRQTQITNEIDWFMKAYQNLIPAMYISYNRTAMYGVEDSELRVTFDSNILWREEELHLSSGAWGCPILKEGQHLMEIKIPGAMPLWLAHMLDELEIYPTSFSKYGRAYLQSVKKNLQVIKGEKKYA
jgi:SPX domain protein involved in polyphosphate accumulation